MRMSGLALFGGVMRKFAVKQKMVAFGDDFYIYDDNRNKLYFVDGKIGGFGNKLLFQDMRKNTIAVIKQKMFTFTPTYRIMENDKERAVVSKKLISFSPSFTVKLANQDRITVKGNLYRHSYKFMRGQTVLARVSKDIISFADSYGVEIEDEANTVLMLSIAIVIDMVLHSKHKH